MAMKLGGGLVNGSAMTLGGMSAYVCSEEDIVSDVMVDGRSKRMRGQLGTLIKSAASRGGAVGGEGTGHLPSRPFFTGCSSREAEAESN